MLLLLLVLLLLSSRIQSLLTKLLKALQDSNLTGLQSHYFCSSLAPALAPDPVPVLAHANKFLTEMNSSFATLSADYGGNAGNAQVTKKSLNTIIFQFSLQWMVALRHLVMKVKEQQEQGKEQEGAITAPL